MVLEDADGGLIGELTGHFGQRVKCIQLSVFQEIGEFEPAAGFEAIDFVIVEDVGVGRAGVGVGLANRGDGGSIMVGDGHDAFVDPLLSGAF